MTSEAAMPLTTEQNKGVACVRCKSQKRGADVCRKEQAHCPLKYPGTSLTQPECKTLMDFRGKLQDHKEALRDQVLLQRAQETDGADGVAAAMAKLKGLPIAPTEVLDLTQPETEQPLAEMIADDWQWSLRPWPGNSDKRYELKTVDVEATFAPTNCSSLMRPSTCISWM